MMEIEVGKEGGGLEIGTTDALTRLFGFSLA